MNMTFFIVLSLVCFTLAASTVSFALIARKGIFNQSDIKNSVFIPSLLILFVTTLAAWFFFYDQDDFIGYFPLTQLLVPFACSALICIIGYYYPNNRWLWLVVVISACLSVLAVPEDNFLFTSALPPLLIRIFLAAGWVLFAFLCRYANNGSAALAGQTIFVALGISILAFMQALPFFIGVYAWLFTIVLFIMLFFSWYPSKIRISSIDAMSLGFLLFSLIVPAITEGAISCCMIFIMFMAVDFLWAFVLKLTFLPQFQNIVENSAFHQAIAKGATPSQAAFFILRAQLMTLILGCFQVYSPMPWSLMLVSFFIILWVDYRFRNMFVPVQTFRNINTQVLEELQDRINEFKDYIKKDDKF